ncbi:MAG: MFS transporter [Deltaproteobacteria bacterium]|nr:MFS transporter [Deltaproteobacteria bacterium]
MDRRINWLLLANAMLGSLLSGTASRIFIISLPTVANSLGTDLTGVSWAFLAYQLSNIGLSLVFGRIGDIYGRERIFGIGFAIFALSSLFCGLSQNVSQLVASRLLQGVSGAMTQSVGRALAAEAMPEELGGRAQSYVTTAFHTGFLLGPTLGGLIIDYVGWRWTFFSLVPFGVAGAILTLSNLKQRETPSCHGPIDYLGAFLLFAIASTLVILLDRRSVELWGTGIQSSVGVIFLVSLFGLFLHERRTPNPMVNFTLFKIRMFMLSNVSLFIMAIGYTITSFLLPFYLQEILHLSPSFIGFLYVVPPVLTILFAPASGYLTDRSGPRLPATLGVATLSFSLLVGAFFKIDSHWLLPTLMLGLSGLANGLFNTANSAGIVGSVPKEHMGFASGTLILMFGLGNVSGIALGSLLMTTAMELHGGIRDTITTAGDPYAFVAALNTTFLVATALSAVALATSITRGAKLPKAAKPL